MTSQQSQHHQHIAAVRLELKQLQRNRARGLAAATLSSLRSIQSLLKDYCPGPNSLLSCTVRCIEECSHLSVQLEESNPSNFTVPTEEGNTSP